MFDAFVLQDTGPLQVLRCGAQIRCDRRATSHDLRAKRSILMLVTCNSKPLENAYVARTAMPLGLISGMIKADPSVEIFDPETVILETA
jgi:hypothetical protein